MPQAPDAYDVFVSYARKDNAKDWITAFMEELKATHQAFTGGRELRPFFDRDDITNGADWEHRIRYGLTHAKLFLAFLSPAYFASEWCRREWKVWLDVEIGHHILTQGAQPIYVVNVPGLTGVSTLDEHEISVRVAELNGTPESARGKLLAEAPHVIRQVRRRQFSPNPLWEIESFQQAGLDSLRREDLRQTLDMLARQIQENSELMERAEASPSTVPHYNPRFTGRMDELLRLRDLLLADDRTGIVTGIQGLGGIGKTELAFTYAHAFAGAYPGGRYLISCEHRDSLRKAILAETSFMANFTHLIGDEEKKRPDVYFAEVLKHLKQRLETQGHLLLVLDNVADAKLLDPDQTQDLTCLSPKLHLLATTRLPLPADRQRSQRWISLGRMSETEALELLEKHRPFEDDVDQAAARQIVHRLGGFSLALELVGAFLGCHPEDTSYAGLAEGLGLDDLEFMAEDSDLNLARHNGERRLDAVLLPVLQSLKLDERRVMEYAALLPPDHVALPWIRDLVNAEFPHLSEPSRMQDPWLRVVKRLTALALITRPEEVLEGNLVRVHRLLQQVIRREFFSDAETLRARQGAVDDLVKQRMVTHKEATRWHWELEPLEGVAKLREEDGYQGGSWLLQDVARYLHRLAEWERAEPMYRSAIKYYEVLRGIDNLNLASVLSDLARLLQETHRYAEAEPYFRQALAIAEASPGPDGSNLAGYLNNLAMLLNETNRFVDAEPILRRALIITEASDGPHHPNLANQLSNLATVLLQTNRYPEAESLLRRALSIDEEYLGPDDPMVAIRLHNLGDLLQRANRPVEAESLIRRALAIDLEKFGPDHPNVALRLHNLARLLNKINRNSEAEMSLDRALTIFEARFGHDSPKVANCLVDLAFVFQQTNRFAEAERLLLRAISIKEGHCGPDAPEVGNYLNRLAILLQVTDRHAEAEILHRRTLAIYEASFGQQSPRLAPCLTYLAEVCKKTNHRAEAEPLLRRALAIAEANFGPDDPEVAHYLIRLANHLWETDRRVEAKFLLGRAQATKRGNGKVDRE